MEKTETLLQNRFYHIYNCGINGENLFKENMNYEYFLKLYDKHIEAIAETYAWCLMPNHFHLLLRIKDLTGFENLSGLENTSGLENLSGLKPPHQYFSNLFNAYTKSINKKYNRHGSLFERPFKRKLVDSEKYFKQLVLYIHNNPVHHGFCSHPSEYSWSSYLTCISIKPTKLQRETVVGWFDDMANFTTMHDNKPDTGPIEKWLEL